MEFVMFSKKLVDRDINGVGEVVSGLDLAGVDLTVRPGGHVLPEDAPSQLPKAVETLSSHGLGVPMITTGVTDADEPHAAGVFSAASECGVGYIKLGYWKYEGFGSVLRQIKEIRDKIDGLQGLSKEYGVNAAIHIHSGDYMSATADLVYRLLEGFDPEHVGAYIDPGHMVIEGGASGWKVGMDLLRDSTRIVAVKDFGWERDPAGQKKWALKHMPLSGGMVPWPEVFRYLRSIEFDGPVSLHSEYEGLSMEEIIAQTSKDISYLRDLLETI
jgi:sugar phosphate isomerase/epimerase